MVDGAPSLHQLESIIEYKSQAGFFLVTDSQDHNSVTVDAVSDDIAAIAELDQPVPVFLGQIVNGASDAWQFSQRLDALDNGFRGSLGRSWAPGPQEFAQPFQVPKRCLGEDHL